MMDTARQVRIIKLHDRRKRLYERSRHLNGRMIRIGDTIFALKARIKQHGDKLDRKQIKRLTEQIRKHRIRYEEYKAEYDILVSGLSYLQLNYGEIIDDTLEEDILDVE